MHVYSPLLCVCVCVCVRPVIVPDQQQCSLPQDSEVLNVLVNVAHTRRYLILKVLPVHELRDLI